MKKALHGIEVFLDNRNGKIEPWGNNTLEILSLVNKVVSGEDIEYPPLRNLSHFMFKWFKRYLAEGSSDSLLDDLNSACKDVRYQKYTVPSDIQSIDGTHPSNAYIRVLDSKLDEAAMAADDFSKLLVSGELDKLKRCKLVSCKKFFFGPPQSKWCCKSCGSKARVSKMRSKRKA